MPETNLPPEGAEPKKACDFDIQIVKYLECLPDDIGNLMLKDHEVVKKLIKKRNPHLKDEEVEVMVEDPEEYEEVSDEPGKKDKTDKNTVPGRTRRRRRKDPEREPEQTPKEDGTPEKVSDETKKKRKKYTNCYDEYKKFEKQYQQQLEDLNSRRAKILSLNPAVQSIDPNATGETADQKALTELQQIDAEIVDLQLRQVNAEEKKNQCLKNLLDLPDVDPEKKSDKSEGYSMKDLNMACKAARDEIKKYNEQIRKLERQRDQVKKANDTIKINSINSEITRIEKLKTDLKNDKCKKGAGGSSSFKKPQLGNLGLGNLGLGNLNLGGLNIPGFDLPSTDFPPFPEMKLGLPEIERAAIDFGGFVPIRFPDLIFKEAIALKESIRICVSAILKLFKDLIVDLIKLAIKIATGIPGAIILLSPPSFNIPGAISFVLFIVDAVSDIIKKVREATIHIPCLKKLDLVLPSANFCDLVGPINVALKFFNVLCMRVKKLDLLICKIIAKIIKKIKSRKKSTIKKLQKEKAKKQEELAELTDKLNSTSDETAKKPIQDDIDGVNEDIKDLDKRIEKVQNQQDSATSAEQANMSKNLIGAAACLVPLLALLKKQDYSEDDPGETPIGDDLPPVEEIFEPVQEELDQVLTYVYDVMFEDGSMLYDVSQDYITELKKLGYNVILNF